MNAATNLERISREIYKYLNDCLDEKGTLKTDIEAYIRESVDGDLILDDDPNYNGIKLYIDGESDSLREYMAITNVPAYVFDVIDDPVSYWDDVTFDMSNSYNRSLAYDMADELQGNVDEFVDQYFFYGFNWNFAYEVDCFKEDWNDEKSVVKTIGKALKRFWN